MTLKIINSLILSLITISFIMYFFSFHPILIAFLVICQSILMTSLISKKILFSWFSFFIFIIYLGGILMLFSYIISLINSKKKIIWKELKIMPPTFLFFFLFHLFKEKKSFLDLSTMKFTKLVMSMFSLSSMKLSVFFMLFLFLVMIMVVFLTETSKGNLRKI